MISGILLLFGKREDDDKLMRICSGSDLSVISDVNDDGLCRFGMSNWEDLFSDEDSKKITSIEYSEPDVEKLLSYSHVKT